MFITKKKHNAIVASLHAELKDARERTQEMKRQRDSAQELSSILAKLSDKATTFTACISGLNISGGSLACESINGIKIGDNIAQYVDDHFGGMVIKQEATKVIEIAPDGSITTGLTKRPADAGFSYILLRK